MHVNDLLKLAVERGASDLHLKVGSYPMARVHGHLLTLSEEKQLDHEDLVEMAASIMSTAQRQKFKDSQEVDLAYSVPGLGRFRCNVFQQRGTIGCVLRVIPVTVKSLDDLGLPPILKEVIMEKLGLILIVGSTGSGKSTTMASMIDYRNTIKTGHILTIEDPVEYELSGINQCGVNVRAGMTFAAGLRAMLRQDPDVIMVGEMRDTETATIAMEAALTGHLVLSTLHTNDAPSAPTRLMDMGVEPFLISSSIIGILAQRLVRVSCTNCKEPYQVSKKDLMRYGFQLPQTMIDDQSSIFK